MYEYVTTRYVGPFVSIFYGDFLYSIMLLYLARFEHLPRALLYIEGDDTNGLGICLASHAGRWYGWIKFIQTLPQGSDLKCSWMEIARVYDALSDKHDVNCLFRGLLRIDEPRTNNPPLL